MEYIGGWQSLRLYLSSAFTASFQLQLKHEEKASKTTILFGSIMMKRQKQMPTDLSQKCENTIGTSEPHFSDFKIHEYSQFDVASTLFSCELILETLMTHVSRLGFLISTSYAFSPTLSFSLRGHVSQRTFMLTANKLRPKFYDVNTFK